MGSTGISDLEVLLAARNGDHEAGCELVRRHGTSMVKTARHTLGRYSGVEAEDIVQDALLAALTTRALPERDVGAWLRSIAARKALDGLRQSTRRSEQPLADHGEGEPMTPTTGSESPDVRVVRAALATLAPLDRAVLLLVDVEGFSMAEAAHAIGATTVAVKWRAVRARRRLRARIEGSTPERRVTRK